MNQEAIQQLVEQIKTLCAGRERIQLMEVCGTHTVSLFRSGVKSLLPKNLRFISGPGCPVCVTSQGYLDAACALADRRDVTICTYGDMVRVPGSTGSLAERRSAGAKVVVVYSPRDALKQARLAPDRKIVFLSVGFETTTPGSAATILEAAAGGVENFFILPGHKLVIPAMRALLSAGDVPIDGFLCPGHVSVVIGADAYRPIAEEYRKPCVVAGFEPRNMLEGIARLCTQIVENRARVENVYPAAVHDEGNVVAREMVDRVFAPADETWRAMGVIPQSGLSLREEFRRFDARKSLSVSFGPDVCPPGCRCGDVIQGKLDPNQCALFGSACTPLQPVGPCMVSSEGACAAWYKYGGE
ncbi:MAG: hydrogenase formation protein HypD [Phycisphaerae bacterium]|nr:hydrogenase formation protein HypD [Phycisphaerae bacterium]